MTIANATTLLTRHQELLVAIESGYVNKEYAADDLALFDTLLTHSLD